MISAQEAGQIALKARMHFEGYMDKTAEQSIRDAASRGEQSCTFVVAGFSLVEFHAKRIVSALSKEGYKASHAIGRDGSITVAVSWLPSIEDFELLSQLKGK